jgi:hypothetical protein
MLREPVANINKTVSARKAKKTHMRVGKRGSRELLGHNVSLSVIHQPHKDVRLDKHLELPTVETYSNQLTRVLKEVLRCGGKGVRSTSALQSALAGVTEPLDIETILAEVAKVNAAGMAIDAILKEFGFPPGGRNNQNLKALLATQEEPTQQEGSRRCGRTPDSEPL